MFALFVGTPVSPNTTILSSFSELLFLCLKASVGGNLGKDWLFLVASSFGIIVDCVTDILEKSAEWLRLERPEGTRGNFDGARAAFMFILMNVVQMFL